MSNETRVEFEMTANEVRIAWAALIDQPLLGPSLQEASKRITDRLMARLQNPAWIDEGRGVFDFTESDANVMVTLLEREPGQAQELSETLARRISRQDDPDFGM